MYCLNSKMPQGQNRTGMAVVKVSWRKSNGSAFKGQNGHHVYYSDHVPWWPGRFDFLLYIILMCICPGIEGIRLGVRVILENITYSPRLCSTKSTQPHNHSEKLSVPKVPHYTNLSFPQKSVLTRLTAILATCCRPCRGINIDPKPDHGQKARTRCWWTSSRSTAWRTGAW